MNFKEFMDLYDNWNEEIQVNDNDLNPIVNGRTMDVIDQHTELWDKQVVAFGFYDDEFCVRLK